LTAYADTSFLAALYVLDEHSTAAAERMKRVKLPLMLTAFGELELANALALRVFRKELPAAYIKAAHTLFARDCADGVLAIQPMRSSVYTLAKQMARRQTPRLGTRTLDVLHVASALVIGADTFYTFDVRQGKLAVAEKLAVPGMTGGGVG
jgi:predicted nucleic acid-binding protein